MQKKLIVLALIVLLVAGLSGCAIYRRPVPTPITPSTPPAAQTEPTGADQVVALVNAIPGVKGSYAVLSGSVALVGVDLRDRMTGDQENALKTRISSEVKRQMPNLSNVWVSADPDVVVRVRDLASKIAQGQPISGLMDEVEALLKKMQPKNS